MQARKIAGVALAVGACALGFWFASSTPHAARSAHDVRVVAPEVVATRATIPTLALGAVPAANARGIPFALTRNAAEAAVRAGRLHIATADGRGFDVAIERNTHDAFGNWHVVGRVQTRIGPQAMVATFGKRAVFAVLPTPDGRTLEVATDHGATTIVEAGSLIPEGMQGFAGNDDSYTLDRLPMPTFNPVSDTRPAASDAEPAPRVQLPTVPVAAALQAASAQATGEVTLNVLGVYGPDFIAARGDEQTVRDELAFMVAVANQAHFDSGSRIRLALSGTLALTANYASNEKALIGIQQVSHTTGGPFPIETARWNASADLVFLARPRGDADASCGAARQGAQSTGLNTLDRLNAFAVANIAPCSPYALSHELGHLLGNAHDRDTEAYNNYDVLRHGVLPYASGYRQFGAPAFATVMADPSGLPTINVFSSPFSSACGAPCGVVDIADEVRSMNAIAGEIAGFAGTPGMATFNDAMGFEPAAGDNNPAIQAHVNFNGPQWPDHFGSMRVQVVGGTATEGVDYTLLPGESYGGDLNSTYVFINMIPDDIVEPDETVILRATSVTGVPLDRDTATITILNDDPRPVIRGAVRFDGATAGSQVDVFMRGGNGNRPDGSQIVVRARAPDFAYAFPVVRGTSPSISVDNGITRGAMPVWIPDVRADRTRDITFRPTHTVIARGISFGTELVDVGQGAPEVCLGQTGLGYISCQVPDGGRLYVTDQNGQGSVARIFDHVRESMDVTLEYTRTSKIVVKGAKDVREGDAGVRRVRFDAEILTAYIDTTPSPIVLDWRVLPGTATAGQDFVATSGTLELPIDGSVASFYVDILGDKLPERAETVLLEVTSQTPGVEVIAPTMLTLRDDDHRASMPGGAEQR